MQRLSNERGGKAYAAIEAGVYKEINSFDDSRVRAGEKSVYALTAALEAQGKTVEAQRLKVDTINAAFDRLEAKQRQLSEDAGGFTFVANLEKSLTPVAQYEGILASLKNNFITAFTGAGDSLDGVAGKTNGASDAVFMLGVRLRTALNSDEARQGVAALVTGFTKVAGAVFDLSSLLWNNKEAVASAAAAWLLLPPVIAGVASAAGLAGGAMGTLTTLGTLAGTAVGAVGLGAAAAVGGVVALGAAALGAAGYFAFAGSEAERAAKKEIAASKEASEKFILDTQAKIAADTLRSKLTTEGMQTELKQLVRQRELRARRGW
jgi:hypothetical protein